MARINTAIMDQIPSIDIEKLNQESTLIVIVDMVNGFVKSGNMADLAISKVIPAQLRLFNDLSKAAHLYFVDGHEKDCQEFQCFPEHCLMDSDESQIIDELKEDSMHWPIIYKNSTNGFLAPGFIDHLDTYMDYDQFVIIGCCSDICVLQFTLSLQTYIHQHDLNKSVYVVLDGIDTYHALEIHDAYLYNEMSYHLLKSAGVKMIKLKEGE